jgi:hypothetical protein
MYFITVDEINFFKEAGMRAYSISEEATINLKLDINSDIVDIGEVRLTFYDSDALDCVEFTNYLPNLKEMESLKTVADRHGITIDDVYDFIDYELDVMYGEGLSDLGDNESVTLTFNKLPY